MLKLKKLLEQLKRKQAELARHLHLSPATVAQIVNHGEWPKSLDEADLQQRISDWLLAQGAQDADIASAFEKVGRQRANAARPAPTSKTNESTKEDSMLLRKQSLYPATRKHFSLFRDPFQDDIQSADDMFISPDIRYVREAMLQTAKHGGFLAVVGESGAGKTTLLRDLEDRIAQENHPVLLIRPYVLAMEDSDAKGKTLRATHIAEAIMAAVAPREKPKSSPEARFQQLHKVLRESHAAGYRHCLVIDEAHAMPIATIKHLKRFLELELGFKKLLSVILIGQPELQVKLSERNADVREVVQRCEVVELAPLDAQLEQFLTHRFKRLDKPVAEVIDAGGIAALRDKLTVRGNGRDRGESVSLLYPLAVGNLLTACMNLAASVGVPTVTADVVKGV